MSGWFEDGDLVVDYRACRVWLTGKELRLSALRFKILHCFVQNAGRPLSTREILRHAWPDEQYDAGLVRWHIAKLRREIGDIPPKRIVHVRGFGYRYDRAIPQSHPREKTRLKWREKPNDRQENTKSTPRCSSSYYSRPILRRPGARW